MSDYTLESTLYFMFTTRRFTTGVPFALASGVISAYENEGLTQITAGITLGADHDGVTGLNLVTVVATAANGFESGKDYHLVITTGTVDSVSVVGEVVGRFTLGRSAAAVDLANGTDGLGAIKAETSAILTDTAEIGTAGAGLTNINLPNQTMDIVGNITGNLSGSVGSIATGGIAAASFAANAINAAALAADAGTEIGTAVWATTTRILTAGTNIQLPSNGLANVTAWTVNITGNLSGTVGSVTGAVGSVTGSVGSVATGGITTASFAAGAINAAAIAPDAIGASELAADAVAEIADAVWDEALSGHAIVGSTGAALTAAGAAGDPWSTLIPGAYGAGTAGFILGTNIDATISSRASQTSVDAVPTNAELATALGTADDAVLAAIAALNDPTVGAIADAVWDELMAGHLIAGSAGEFQANTPTTAQIVAGILAGEITELPSVPGASPQLEEAIALIYMAVRNKRDTTATTDEIHNSGGTVIGIATVSDDGTTFTKGKYA